MAADIPWLAHGLSLGTPIGLAVTFYDGSLFSYHVAAMSVTFLFLVPQGIILSSRAFKHKHRGASIANHVRVQLGALLLGLAGLAAMFLQRQHARKKHFNTLHSWLGVLTILMMESVGFMGMMVYYGIPMTLRRQFPKFLLLHRAIGRLTFVLSAMTVLVALKIFEPEHHRHKGKATYFAAAVIVAQVVGMNSVLWPLTTRSTATISSSDSKYPSSPKKTSRSPPPE